MSDLNMTFAIEQGRVIMIIMTMLLFMVHLTILSVAQSTQRRMLGRLMNHVKETAVAYLKVESRHSPLWTEKSHDNPQP
jgi:accessory gene regulator protein AgrB